MSHLEICFLLATFFSSRDLALAPPGNAAVNSRATHEARPEQGKTRGTGLCTSVRKMWGETNSRAMPFADELQALRAGRPAKRGKESGRGRPLLVVSVIPGKSGAITHALQDSGATSHAPLQR
jgi:hypothetical protein